jgi:hypothetical protein
MLKKLLSYMVVATAIAPAAVSPAVAGCCGAYAVSGSITVNQTGGGSLTTTDTVTNTSMQMTVSEDAVFVPTEYAPDLTTPTESSTGTTGEVM